MGFLDRLLGRENKTYRKFESVFAHRPKLGEIYEGFEKYGKLTGVECSNPFDPEGTDYCILEFEKGKSDRIHPNRSIYYYTVMPNKGGRKTRRSPIKKRTRKAIKKTHRRRKD